MQSTAQVRFRLVGVVHLQPLPGSPRWGGSMAAVCEAAASDAAALEGGGADAIVVENFGDLPFTAGAVPPETVAAMALTASAVRRHSTRTCPPEVSRPTARPTLWPRSPCQAATQAT